jgi:hypothetical protein
LLEARQPIGRFLCGRKVEERIGSRWSVSAICEAIGSIPFHATWNQAGDILFVAEPRGLAGCGVSSQVAAPPQSRRRLIGLRKTGHLWPYFLPDGQHYLYVVTAERWRRHLHRNARCEAWAPAAAFRQERRRVEPGLYGPGYVLYVLGRTLAQRFDAGLAEPPGEPVLSQGRPEHGRRRERAFSVSSTACSRTGAPARVRHRS